MENFYGLNLFLFQYHSVTVVLDLYQRMIFNSRSMLKKWIDFLGIIQSYIQGK
jgi:hypothetical protein